jgi:adenine deaminase
LADFFIFDDVKRPIAKQVFTGGARHVAEAPHVYARLRSTVKLRDLSECNLRVPARGKRIRVVGAIPDQLWTEHRILDARIEDGFAVADTSRDILKIAVINRHGGDSIGLGFIQGIGLLRGAIAGTVAHDHHNLVVIGCDDRSMLTAIRGVAKNAGGLAAAAGDQTLATLGLPVAGLMSDRPIAQVRDAYAALLAAAKELGSSLHDPFMAMSFMALEVIPSLKLTDMGLVDVEAFRFVNLFP